MGSVARSLLRSLFEPRCSFTIFLFGESELLECCIAALLHCCIAALQYDFIHKVIEDYRFLLRSTSAKHEFQSNFAKNSTIYS